MGGRIDHQRAVAGLGILDQVGNGHTTAAARQVLKGCIVDQPGIDQRLARAARGAVPAATSAAGDQEMHGIHHLARLVPEQRRPVPRFAVAAAMTARRVHPKVFIGIPPI